jgi:hypothetical protein
MPLDKQSIGKRSTPKVTLVSIPEWEESVFIRQMNSRERDRYEGESLEAKGKFWDNLRARLLVVTLSDSEGNRLYQDDELEAVASIPGPVADLLWSAAMSWNKMFKEDVVTAEKN